LNGLALGLTCAGTTTMVSGLALGVVEGVRELDGVRELVGVALGVGDTVGETDEDDPGLSDAVGVVLVLGVAEPVLDATGEKEGVGVGEGTLLAATRKPSCATPAAATDPDPDPDPEPEPKPTPDELEGAHQPGSVTCSE